MLNRFLDLLATRSGAPDARSRPATARERFGAWVPGVLAFLVALPLLVVSWRDRAWGLVALFGAMTVFALYLIVVGVSGSGFKGRRAL